MIGLALRFWRPALALAFAAGIWLHGHYTGRTGCETRAALAQAEAERAAWRAAEAASRKEAARLAVEAERDALARELEDAANADPVAAPACLGPERVRRLNLR